MVSNMEWIKMMIIFIHIIPTSNTKDKIDEDIKIKNDNEYTNKDEIIILNRIFTIVNMYMSIKRTNIPKTLCYIFVRFIGMAFGVHTM